MKTSNTGFILALIGGILCGVFGFFLSIISLFMFIFGIPFLLVGLWVLATSIAVIYFSFWMKNPKKSQTGAILVLIFSILGGGTIIGIIGGIIGLVEANS